jgi:hypothetical protein
VWEQIGYQQENPGLRNVFLAGAYELRSGIPEGESPKSSGPDMIRAMSTDLFLEFLGIRMDSKKADGLEFTMNFITPDNGEKFVVELSNSTLTNLEGFLAEDPDLTITINRSDLEPVMIGAKTLEQQIVAGKAKLEGDTRKVKNSAEPKNATISAPDDGTRPSISADQTLARSGSPCGKSSEVRSVSGIRLHEFRPTPLAAVLPDIVWIGEPQAAGDHRVPERPDPSPHGQDGQEADPPVR